MEVMNRITTIVGLLAVSALFTPIAETNISVKHSPCSAAIAEKEDRIVGGVQAEEHEFPSIVTLTNPFEFCAGNIISQKWILSAAHCAQYPASAYKITANVYNIKNESGSEVTFKVSKVIVHPSYDVETGANDISMMELSTPITFNHDITPIPMAPNNFTADGDGTVVGWGLERGTQTQLSHIIRKVQIPIIPNPECKKFFASNNSSKPGLSVDILDTMLCAGKSGESACFGDSGGPFICPNADIKYGWLCGIVSSGKKCGELGIFTRVSSYSEWIAQVMEGKA